MSRPLAIVVGFIGKQPIAGMAYYNIHYIVGLQELGYEVHFVERQNRPLECYDPSVNDVTDSAEYALQFLAAVLPRFNVDRFSFIDRDDRCHGSGWEELKEAVRRADFVLTLADETWFDELGLCKQRAFIDGDPMITQIGMLNEDPHILLAIRNYPVLFSCATRMGEPDCTVPALGREWLPSRPVVATSLWDETPATDNSPITNVMLWSGKDMLLNGKVYGHKSREFERFLELPQKTAQTFALAVGGKKAPREVLRRNGWRLLDPLEQTGTLDSYQAFIKHSRADFGVAKHAYAASRSGWFSDRSTCYLAAGRPVLHQDTGCGDWLPTGNGVFLFSEIEDVLEAIDIMNADYQHHARAARQVAQEHFEARKVLGHMLDDIGFR